jgi:hypothetical protein
VRNAIFTSAELERLALRARSADFRPAIQRLRREADEFYAMRLAVPEWPGGYYHDYTCPQHGVELRFDPLHPTEHRCPVDQARFAGERFDAAWRWFANHHLAESAFRLALLWRVEATPRHRETVRSILLGYAARYDSYRHYPNPGENPGIATYTTLDESVWSIPLAWAFSLIAETLSADESDQIVSQLLVPVAEHLVRRRYKRIHNFACWHNAAIATIGRVAGRTDLLRFALEGELGQRSQLRNGMLADGLWYEGSMSYHFYSVWAILVSVLACRHESDTDISRDEAVRKSLLAPMACAGADGTLPATNDCWYFISLLGECCHGVPPASDFYELAFMLYREPAFAMTLHRKYVGALRDSPFALLLGAEALPPALASARTSVNLPESGLAILRPAEGVDLMLKYGPHGGHHGHPDKLSLAGWAHGWKFSPDLGTPGYGVAALETWYRQTLSHNTVLIDGESQPPGHGRLISFDSDSAVVAVELEGVKLRRALLARAEYFIDVFMVDCGRPRCIDWIYHNAGNLSSASSGQTVESIAGGMAYRHLSGVRKHVAEELMKLQWRDRPFGLQLWLSAKSGEQIFTGTSPSNPPTSSLGFLLRRQIDAQAVFVSVLHPHRDEPLVRNVEFPESGGLVVHLAGRTDHWTADQLQGRMVGG